jgi:RNA polymerase sigma-70 factor (ECF subfamily)
MTEKQRLVFVLYELHGLSGDEIARVIGSPPATVRGRLRKARLAFSQGRTGREEAQ